MAIIFNDPKMVCICGEVWTNLGTGVEPRLVHCRPNWCERCYYSTEAADTKCWTLWHRQRQLLMEAS